MSRRVTATTVAPKGDSMQHKSVPLLINSADDDSGTFTGLASVFDNLDHDGDICSSRCLQQVTR